MLFIQVIRLRSRPSRESISYCVCYTLDIVNLKVKILNLCNPLSNKSSQQICGSVIKLSNKNLYISFQDKIDSIQPVLKSLKALENSLAFPFYNIVITLYLILESGFVLSDLTLSILSELSYNSSLTFKTCIYSDINSTLSWPILNFVQGQCSGKSCFKAVYGFFLFYSLVLLDIFPKELIDRCSDYSKTFDLDPVIHTNSNKRPSFSDVPISQPFQYLDHFRSSRGPAIIPTNKPNDIHPIMVELRFGSNICPYMLNLIYGFVKIQNVFVHILSDPRKSLFIVICSIGAFDPNVIQKRHRDYQEQIIKDPHYYSYELCH